MSRPSELAPPLQVAVGILFDQAGRVLINERPPGKDLAGYWEFPGGKQRADETERDALGRELAEELGVAVIEAEVLIRLTHRYPARTVRLTVWRVTEYGGVPSAKEEQRLDWVRPDELASRRLLPADGPIVDAILSESAGG